MVVCFVDIGGIVHHHCLMLDKTEGAIKNCESRDTGNIGYFLFIINQSIGSRTREGHSWPKKLFCCYYVSGLTIIKCLSKSPVQ